MENCGIFKDFNDESIKCVFKNNNGFIEMTLLQNRNDTDVVCVPTHYFCNLGCKMCHLTNNSLIKKSIPITIDSFIKALELTVKNQKTLKRRTNKKKLLISFMGVGEPTLNFDLIKDVFDSTNKLKQLLDYEYIGFALASMLPNKNLKKITNIVNEKNIPLKIHFSLHSPIDRKRNELIPKSNNTILDCLNMLKEYENTIKNNQIIMKEFNKCHKSDDVVEVHYTLIKNINDTNEDLYNICDLLKKYKFTIKFIKFNQKEDMSISNKENQWVEFIKENCNTKVKQYAPPGKNIGASCGEFTKHYYHEEIETKEQLKEFLNWKQKYEVFD